MGHGNIATGLSIAAPRTQHYCDRAHCQSGGKRQSRRYVTISFGSPTVEQKMLQAFHEFIASGQVHPASLQLKIFALEGSVHDAVGLFTTIGCSHLACPYVIREALEHGTALRFQRGHEITPRVQTQLIRANRRRRRRDTRWKRSFWRVCHSEWQSA